MKDDIDLCFHLVNITFQTPININQTILVYYHKIFFMKSQKYNHNNLINQRLICRELLSSIQYFCINYEGDSIYNEIVPINQKVLYLYALQLHSQKGLLLGYTTAKSQLSSSFTTLHNLLSRKGNKLHCDTNLSSGFKLEYCMS